MLVRPRNDVDVVIWFTGIVGRKAWCKSELGWFVELDPAGMAWNYIFPELVRFLTDTLFESQVLDRHSVLRGKNWKGLISLWNKILGQKKKVFGDEHAHNYANKRPRTPIPGPRLLELCGSPFGVCQGLLLAFRLMNREICLLWTLMKPWWYNIIERH